MNDFYMDDEPVEDVVAAFNAGEKGVTARPTRRFVSDPRTLSAQAYGPFVGAPMWMGYPMIEHIQPQPMTQGSTSWPASTQRGATLAHNFLTKGTR